jgi:hypothetical protein
MPVELLELARLLADISVTREHGQAAPQEVPPPPRR